jgi:arylformamidase
MISNRITDWDDAYANGAHIKDGESYPPKWEAAAAAYRESRLATERARLDVSYGTGAREVFDLYLPDGDMRGILVFVHGGYWRAFDKSSWSHLSAGANARGYAVVLPSYTLCPQAQISDITGQVARAINQAAGMLSGPVYLAGHSAGGHLVSRMVCATSPLSRGVADRVQQVMSISGLHDLRPLLRTAMNRDLRLDFNEATRESPVLLPPKEGARLHAWVGADERPEFVRQSELIANIWSGCGAETDLTIEPSKHHFDVIDSLCDPKSAMLDALLGDE